MKNKQSKIDLPMTKGGHAVAGVIYLLPFILFFLICGTALLQGAVVENSSQQDGSIINQIFLSFSYLLAFVLLIKRGRIFGHLVVRAFPLVIMLIYIGFSMTWSLFPSAVLISFVHQSGTALVAMCAIILWCDDKDKFFKTLLNFVFFYLLLTIVVSHLLPSVGVMPATRWNPGGLWRGLTTHSNSLGILCFISIWVSLASFFNVDKKNKTTNIVVFMAIIFGFYCLYRTNSMTSTVLSAALSVSAIWFWFIGSASMQVKFIKLLFSIFLIIAMIFCVYIMNPDFFSTKIFFKLIGRNETFTGRTTLWEHGLKAISIHPYLGWSFDSLRSYLSQYSLGYGQLHNGYLDLTLRGGMTAVLFLLLMVIKMGFSLLKLRSSNISSYYFASAMFVAIMIHNITEASFFRNTHPLWLMFLVLYFYCLYCNYSARDKRVSL